MMRFRAATLAFIVAWAATGPTQADSPANPFESDVEPVAQGPIDEHVLGRLQQLGITPARVCSDGVFVRRVYLDVIGTLPTADEARWFLQDTDPDKRRKLIDRLLERDEFANYWAMKWCDLLRVKSEFPIKLWPNAVQAYHRWIRTAIRENMPYDQFVREMLTSSGSNFRDPQVNFYRAVQSREPQAIAQAVALTFMGVRPETWSPQQWSAMAAFFSQIAYKPTIEWKEEIILFDLEKSRSPAGREALRLRPSPMGRRFRSCLARIRGRCLPIGSLLPKTPGSRGMPSIVSGSGCWEGESSSRRRYPTRSSARQSGTVNVARAGFRLRPGTT